MYSKGRRWMFTCACLQIEPFESGNLHKRKLVLQQTSHYRNLMIDWWLILCIWRSIVVATFQLIIPPAFSSLEEIMLSWPCRRPFKLFAPEFFDDGRIKFRKRYELISRRNAEPIFDDLNFVQLVEVKFNERPLLLFWIFYYAVLGGFPHP